MTYEWFAETYGFTELQTRNEMSLDALNWWPIIRAARIKATETRQNQNARVDQATHDVHQPFRQGMKTPGSG